MESPKSNRSKNSENENPNHTSNSPLLKSKSKKSASKNPNGNDNSPSLKNRIGERKFVVAKKSKKCDGLNQLNCKCNKGKNGNLGKCLCVAYESLRASQEEFFKNRGVVENDFDDVEEYGNVKGVGISEMTVSAVKRSRERLLEEVQEGVPQPGAGRVMYLVEAFEKLRLLSGRLSEFEESGKGEEGKGKECLKWALPCLGVETKTYEGNGKDGVKWALPGLADETKTPEGRLSNSSLCPSDLFLTSECLGLDSCRESSLDSARGRNSSESVEGFARRQRRKRQQLKTTAKPFKLRTEERGKCKEEEFMKKLQRMREEEEKLRVPIAQGLPCTTDKPEYPEKPLIKEATRPIDVVLHSDVRAEERAEFDHQVAEKMSLIEQYKTERERQQKLDEEEEIRRLRKELVPKAQPMPYFDRPFIPRRSEKQPTIPKEPKFHVRQHKKIKCIQQSWCDTCSYISSSSDVCDVV